MFFYKRLKKELFFLLICFFFISKDIIIYANSEIIENEMAESDIYLTTMKNVNTIKKLDISSRIITGEKVPYTIVIPEGIVNFISVERVVVNKNVMMEKLNFYCNSYSDKYKPGKVMSFYVFSRSQWSESYNLQKVKSTKNYIFAIETFDENPFSTVEDRALYLYVQSTIGKPEAVKKILRVPATEIIEDKNMIFVDGNAIGETVEIIDDIYYIPLRPVCEELGYSIEWDNGLVIIKKGSFRDSIVLTNNVKYATNGKVLIHNDRTYVSTSYFIRTLGKSVEIDENHNIFIVN